MYRRDTTTFTSLIYEINYLRIEVSNKRLSQRWYSIQWSFMFGKQRVEGVCVTVCGSPAHDHLDDSKKYSTHSDFIVGGVSYVAGAVLLLHLYRLCTSSKPYSIRRDK